MAIHVTEQLRTFLLSILLGLGAGVLYDLLRAVRLRHPRLTAPLDLLYCQAVGLAVFLFVLRQSDGQLRGFILLGGLGGGVLFFSLLSRPLRPVWDFWMDRWMELFQFLSLPGRFCAAVCKKFAFQAKTLFFSRPSCACGRAHDPPAPVSYAAAFDAYCPNMTVTERFTTFR